MKLIKYLFEEISYSSELEGYITTTRFEQGFIVFVGIIGLFVLLASIGVPEPII